MVLTLVVLAAFSLGCAGMASKDTQVKCPKCGAVFTIDEGLKAVTRWWKEQGLRVSTIDEGLKAMPPTA
jgi:hypothetical protein